VKTSTLRTVEIITNRQRKPPMKHGLNTEEAVMNDGTRFQLKGCDSYVHISLVQLYSRLRQ